MVDRRRADAVDEAAARFSATVGEVPEVELSGRGLLRSSVPFITCWREEERFRRRTLAGVFRDSH